MDFKAIRKFKEEQIEKLKDRQAERLCQIVAVLVATVLFMGFIYSQDYLNEQMCLIVTGVTGVYMVMYYIICIIFIQGEINDLERML